jgi:hypothetical protein
MCSTLHYVVRMCEVKDCVYTYCRYTGHIHEGKNVSKQDMYIAREVFRTEGTYTEEY